MVEYPNFDRIVEGHTVPLSELSDKEADLAYVGACMDKFVMSKSFHLAPVMEENIWYQLNPEHKDFKLPTVPIVPKEPEIIRSNGVQAVFHPISFRSGTPRGRRS